MIYQYTYFHFERMDKQIKKNSIQIKILALLFLASIVVTFIRIPELIKSSSILPQEKIWVQIDTPADKISPTPLELPKKGVVEVRQREISAYNVGDASQTDDSPCIGASGVDICNLLDHDICVYAANFVPLGTYLEIDGKSCQVLDRMNKKYNKRVDIAMKLLEKEKAVNFGVQTKEVKILK